MINDLTVSLREPTNVGSAVAAALGLWAFWAASWLPAFAAVATAATMFAGGFAAAVALVPGAFVAVAAAVLGVVFVPVVMFPCGGGVVVWQRFCLLWCLWLHPSCPPQGVLLGDLSWYLSQMPWCNEASIMN